MASGKFIAYLRVSTERQGRSGLGLDAQQAAITQFLNGGSWQLVGTYVEVESGRKDDRPQLAAALMACRLQGATLIVAKLDRLSRSVSFISTLMESNVEFRACDMPEANKLVLHIMASMAQHEREMISARTKAALAQAKLRGVKLGNPNLKAPKDVHVLGVAAIKLKADKDAADRLPIIKSIMAEGITSLRGIAAELTRRGIQTPRGSTTWQSVQVQRLIDRAKEEGISK
jgi:DNA invertase Pin-like site-specific DNA recombinase